MAQRKLMLLYFGSSPRRNEQKGCVPVLFQWLSWIGDLVLDVGTQCRDVSSPSVLGLVEIDR